MFIFLCNYIFLLQKYARMRQRYVVYLAYNIYSVIERYQLTASYYSYLILSYIVALSFFLRFFAQTIFVTLPLVNRKSIALTKRPSLTKRPAVKRMIQLGFVVRQFYNSLVTVGAHKEARNSFRPHDKRVFPFRNF